MSPEIGFRENAYAETVVFDPSLARWQRPRSVDVYGQVYEHGPAVLCGPEEAFYPKATVYVDGVMDKQMALIRNKEIGTRSSGR